MNKKILYMTLYIIVHTYSSVNPVFGDVGCDCGDGCTCPDEGSQQYCLDNCDPYSDSRKSKKNITQHK